MAKRKLATDSGGFLDALEPLLRMERCVCYRTVTCNYTLPDVIEWLWDAGTRTVLRDAYTSARKPSSAVYTANGFYLPGPGGYIVDLDIDLGASGMLIPERGLINLQSTPKSAHIICSIEHVVEIHHTFERVRKVIHWLANNATTGAAKFYFPIIGSLLPAEHSFHKARGELYREPKRPIAEIAADMRLAMTTIAQGLLTYDTNLEHEAKHFKLQVRDPNDPNATSKMSQVFCLI